MKYGPIELVSVWMGDTLQMNIAVLWESERFEAYSGFSL